MTTKQKNKLTVQRASKRTHRNFQALHRKVILTLNGALTMISVNNTPPASRQISAQRGVTRFWGTENLVALAKGATQ